MEPVSEIITFAHRKKKMIIILIFPSLLFIIVGIGDPLTHRFNSLNPFMFCKIVQKKKWWIYCFWQKNMRYAWDWIFYTQFVLEMINVKRSYHLSSALTESMANMNHIYIHMYVEFFLRTIHVRNNRLTFAYGGKW